MLLEHAVEASQALHVLLQRLPPLRFPPERVKDKLEAWPTLAGVA